MHNKTRQKNKKNSAKRTSKYMWKRKESSNSPDKEKFSDTITIPGKNGILRDKIIKTISSAKEILCICSYIIADEKIETAILDATERGVRVYILTAYEKEFLDKLPPDEQEQKWEMHLALIRKLQYRAIIRSSPDYHAKFVLSDPKNLPNKSGIFLTCNLGKTPLNKSPEIGIQLTKKQVDYLFHKFIEGFWHESLAKTEIDMSINCLPEVGFAPTSKVIPVQIPAYPGFTDMISTIDTISEINNHLIQMINSSEGDLIVFAFSYDADNQVISELLKALQQGRKVSIFVFINPDKRYISSVISKMKNSGAEIFGIEYLHAKGLITNFKHAGTIHRLATIMTTNFTTLGLDSGFNFAMKLDHQRTQVVERILEYWKGKCCWTLDFSDNFVED